MSTRQLTIADLERWVQAGAHWRVLEIGEGRAVLELCSCVGEPVERVESGAPDVIAYLRAARSDLELGTRSEGECEPAGDGDAAVA